MIAGKFPTKEPFYNMSNKQNANKIAELSAEIIKHRGFYYNNLPVLSDAAFDRMVDELKGLDPNNAAIVSIGAPIDVNSEWEKATHEIALGSLDKVNTIEEFKEWATKHFRPNDGVFITEKIDGLSIELIYKDGNLASAVTRGNSIIGENIYRNVIKMTGVKKIIPDFTGSLRGEILLKRSNHKKYFPTFANPRNAASGISKRLDGKESEHLDIFFYQLIGNVKIESETEQFQMLQQWGLNVPSYVSYDYKSIDTLCDFVNDYWENYHDKRKDLDYDIDGLVVRINNLQYQLELGDKHLRPVGARAFKFRFEGAETIVTNIVNEVGNSGRITPVVEFETVPLMGSNVSRASAYNYSFIRDMGIDIGAKIIAYKANDVIPAIKEVIKGTGTIFPVPNKCPVCNGPTKTQGENLMCESTDTCNAQVVGRILNWISSLNILEWGSALVERLVEAGKLITIADLYKLSIEDLAVLDRMGKKSATKCFASLWSHNPIPLEIFLGSISIPMVATSTIKMIMDGGYDTLEKMFSITEEQLNLINGLGPVKSKSFLAGIKRNKNMIMELLELGLKVQDSITGVFTNKSLNFTGTMINKRKTLEDLVIKNGGQIKSVGKTLSYLVIDDVNSTTDKAVSARKFNIKMISEEEFLKMAKS